MNFPGKVPDAADLSNSMEIYMAMRELSMIEVEQVGGAISQECINGMVGGAIGGVGAGIPGGGWGMVWGGLAGTFGGSIAGGCWGTSGGFFR